MSRVKKGVINEFFSEIVVFLVKKGSYTTSNKVKIRKIRKTWSMTKKKVIRNFGRENGNFFGKNVIQKSGSAKKFPSPKLGARSPPLVQGTRSTKHLTNKGPYH